MQPLFILAILASAVVATPPIPRAMDISATKCKLIGSGSIICRSCPSLNCDKMDTWYPGDYVNADCMCHGQMQGGVE